MSHTETSVPAFSRRSVLGRVADPGLRDAVRMQVHHGELEMGSEARE
jgi:hypothetical protein